MNRLPKDESKTKTVLWKNFQQNNFLEIISNPFYALDENWCILYVNTAAESALRVKREELLGTNIWKIYPALVETVFYEKFSEAMQNKELVSFEAKGYFNETWLEVNVYPCEHGICIFTNDITEKKAREKALKESEERYRLICENSPNAIMIHAGEKIVYANRKAEKLFGCSGPGELVGKEVKKFVHPDYYETVKERIQQRITLREETPLLEQKLVRLDGTTVDVNVMGIYIEYDGIPAGLVTFRDITDCKKIEAALRSSEERFRSVVQTAGDAIICVDARGEIAFWNKGAEKIFGFSDIEATGNSIKIIITKESLNKYLDVMNKVESGVLEKTVEIKCVSKSGVEIPVDLSMSKWQVNGSCFFTLILRNITQRKLVEESIRISEEKFRNAFDYAAVGKVIADLRGNFIKVNNSFCRFTGFTEKELVMKSFSDIIDSEDNKDEISSYIQRLLDGEINSCQFQKPFSHKQGNLIWGSVNISIVRDRKNNPEFLISQIQDISEQKRAEQALKQSEEKFRMIFDNASDSMILISVDEYGECIKVLEANETAEHYFGKVKGKEASEIFGRGEGNKTTWKENLRKILKNQNVRWENEIFTEKEGLISFEFSSKLFRINNKKVILTVARDISERKLAENALKEINNKLNITNEELVKTSQYKTEFLNNMTHEFKAPLTAILVLTSELLSDGIGILSDRQEEYIKDIQDSARQLLDLVNDLLELSKLESGKMGLNLTTIRIGSIAHDLVKRLHPLANQKKIKINSKFEDNNMIIADVRKIGHVITNLLSNAIKFSNPDSNVELIVYDISEPDAGIMIKVKDFGPGIPEEEHQLIFDSFYQVSRGLTKNYPGTGLGLALVKKIVDLHTGWLKLESCPGTGTVFSIFFPSFPAYGFDLE